MLPPIDPNLAPTQADADLERRIETLRRQLAVGCGTKADTSLLWSRMAALVKQRSPAMVAALEEAKGLAKVAA
jgi:hypothetical protein